MTKWFAIGRIVAESGRRATSHGGFMIKSEQLQAAVDRIARMKYAGVSHDQIATACGIDVAMVEDLLEKKEVQDRIAELSADAFDKFETVNDAWDMVEMTAVSEVYKELDARPDPEFALKAATLANKAQRHNRNDSRHNHVAMQPNQQAVIQVAIGFAQSLQQNFQVQTRDVSELKKKDDNFLPPKKVQELLSATVDPEDEEMEKLAREMNQLSMFAPA